MLKFHSMCVFPQSMWCVHYQELTGETMLSQVEEVKRRQHCLMFSSAGPQAQTYYVNFDTLADYQRWHRQASKVSECALSNLDMH